MRERYEEKNHQYWDLKIAESKGNSRMLWRTLDGVMKRTKDSQDHGCPHNADDFANFFTDKIEGIRVQTSNVPAPEEQCTAKNFLGSWKAVTPADVYKLIGSAPNKSCQLDPVPTWIVKELRSSLSPFIALLFNKSLSTGCFPSAYKHAIVTPLLKKENLDANQLKNYRPVSNLSLLSKLLERVVKDQLQAFLDDHGMMPRHQSAYRHYHSTETLMVKVLDDLLRATDDGQVSALCLLDMTAAFDTVDHDILLRRLERCFGVQSTALNWLRSYLSDRTYCVVFAGEKSSVTHIVCSVPQGSVLGPLLFILYTADLAYLAQNHGVTLDAFADDTQLHIHCEVRDVAAATESLKQCIQDVGEWLSANRLKLNAEKTELLWTGSRHAIKHLPCGGPFLALGVDNIVPNESASCLGVAITRDLSFEKQVSNTCRKCFFQLRQLRRVRRSLDKSSAATLIHAFVTSRIDYCNSLLAGSPKTVTDKLQRVLRSAARILTETGKYDRGLTHILHNELHWLDVPQRIKFKVCTMVYKCLHGMAPPYLVNLCKPVAGIDGRNRLRSASWGQLVVPRPKLSTYGKRAFSYVGPSTWNSLPVHLKNNSFSLEMFKNALKTFLFTEYT